MKKIRQTTISLALLALLAFGGISAGAKQADRHRVVSGIVTRIDLNSRTLEVREIGSRRTIAVQVPTGTTVETNLAMSPSVTLERLLPGMYVRATVQ